MILLNSKIWTETVSEAKAKAAGSAEWLRAIEKADKQVRRARYWAFDSETNVLKLMSARNSTVYTISATEHACPATENGRKVCYHRAAHRLMVRYVAKLGNVAAIEAEAVRAQAWSKKQGHFVTETARVRVTPAPSRMAEAAAAPLVPRTIKGEQYNGIDI